MTPPERRPMGKDDYVATDYRVVESSEQHNPTSASISRLYFRRRQRGGGGVQIALSILYFVSYFAAFISILLFPKETKSQNGVTWIPIAFFLLMSFDGLVAGICTILHIPVGLVSQGIGNILLTITLAILGRRRGGAQSLSFSRRDIVFFAVFTLIALIVMRTEFGSDISPRYLVTDPINHFRRSLMIFFDGTVSHMYQVWNFIATAIGVASGFVRFDMYYKVYCICDALLWYFGGLLFYSVVCRILKRPNKEVLAGIFSILYVLGYPLVSLVWGFCYLGVGVSFSMLAIYFTQRTLRKEDQLAFFGLALSLYGVVTSYILFAPFIFATSFVPLLISYVKTKQSPRIVLPIIGLVYVVPGLLGSWFFYVDTLGTGTVTVTTALGAEGGIYRNLYSNLVLFAPLFLAALWRHVKCKQLMDSNHALTLLVLLMTYIILLIPTYTHALSTYYLAKIQFLIWPLALLAAAEGVEIVLELPGKVLLGCYAVVMAFLFVMVAGQVDKKIVNAFQPIGLGNPTNYHPYLDVYDWNYQQVRYRSIINPDVWKLYHKASDYVEDGYEVPIVAAGMYSGWYYCITCQLDDISSIRSSSDEWRSTADEVVSDGYEYLVVIPIDFRDQGNNGAADASKYLLSLEGTDVVYQNTAGYILKLPT